MKNIILGLTFVVAASAAALAGDGGGGGDEQVSFDTPSRNLCCTYTPAGGTAVYSTPDGSAELTCSREKPQYWIVSLTELGRYHVDEHPGEVPGCGNTDIIAYGETRHVGPFTCKSKTNGITCTVNAKASRFQNQD